MHILVSRIILQQEEPGLLSEMADSRTGAGIIPDEPGASYSQKVRKRSTGKETYHDGVSEAVLEPMERGPPWPKLAALTNKIKQCWIRAQSKSP